MRPLVAVHTRASGDELRQGPHAGLGAVRHLLQHGGQRASSPSHRVDPAAQQRNDLVEEFGGAAVVERAERLDQQICGAHDLVDAPTDRRVRQERRSRAPPRCDVRHPDSLVAIVTEGCCTDPALHVG